MKDIKDLSANIEKFVAERIADTTEELYQGIRARTPVRGGRAQRGWERNQPSRERKEDGIIGNSVPYITYLEYGSSDQAPFGMVRVTIAEVLRARRR